MPLVALGLLILLTILLLFLYLFFRVIAGVLGSGSGEKSMGDTEARDLQELHRVLERMEQRIDRLEDELTRRLQMESER